MGYDPDAADALAAFQSAHGRLCTLYAQAVTIGYQRTVVASAARGEGGYYGPTLAGLRQQRERTTKALRRAQSAGVTTLELVSAARNVRMVVEKEWNMAILLQER